MLGLVGMMIHKNDIHFQHGFTIIEVIIVLAIAGFIILIVFLAVPFVERLARNHERKNDAAHIVTGLQEYVQNNDDSYFGVGPAAGGFTFCPGVSPTCSFLSEVNLVYYKVNQIWFAWMGPQDTGFAYFLTDGTGVTDENRLVVQNRTICNADGTVHTGSEFSNFIVAFAQESGSGTFSVCLDGNVP